MMYDLVYPNGMFFHVGYLITTGCSVSGRGDSAVVHIACSGCGEGLNCVSSALSTTECRQNVVSYALRLAAFVLALVFLDIIKCNAQLFAMMKQQN